MSNLLKPLINWFLPYLKGEAISRSMTELTILFSFWESSAFKYAITIGECSVCTSLLLNSLNVTALYLCLINNPAFKFDMHHTVIKGYF